MMETLYLSGKNAADIETAGRILKSGGLAAIPTETVYGLAANALCREAVKKIFEVKGRPGDNPLIVHICDIKDWAPLVREIPEAALRLAKACWPGPLTIILPKSDLIPMETSGGLDTVGVRFPSHPVAQAVIRAAGVPVAAPSANPSGRPSPTTLARVKEDLTGKIEAIVDGGDCDVGVESTVISLATEVPLLLRPGGVTLRQLRAVLGRVELDPAVLHRLESGRKASSPGMKYKHYAPKANVIMVDASPEEYANYVNQFSNTEHIHALCFDEDLPMLKIPYVSCGSRYDSAAQAHRLFSSLYRLDEMGAETVYAHRPSQNGVGLAVYNRLIRSAGFQVINPAMRQIVGLTGQSGAGKSSVAAAFKDAGFYVIDCDSLTRSGKTYTPECIAKLMEAFGEDIAADGVLNRRLLAERAFADSAKKAELNGIVFPYIIAAVREEIEKGAALGHKVIVIDAPTLFEAGADSVCSRIAVVTAPEDERLKRILSRDGINREEALRRFNAQHDEEFFISRADYVIENGAGKNPAREAEAVISELKGSVL